MKKLKDIKSNVRLTLDKLAGIRVDLVRLDYNWQKWDFCQLVDSLRIWTGRNSKTAGNPEKNILEGKICSKSETKIKNPHMAESIVKNLVINLVSVSQ